MCLSRFLPLNYCMSINKQIYIYLGNQWRPDNLQTVDKWYNILQKYESTNREQKRGGNTSNMWRTGTLVWLIYRNGVLVQRSIP